MSSHNMTMMILVCSISILLLSSVFAIEGPVKTGRKILWHVVEKGAPIPEPRLYDSKTDNRFIFSSKILGMGVPAVLILGCVFVCPCFQHKKKKEINSLDLSSSSEGNSNLKKVPPTPPRRNQPPIPPASRYPPPSPSRSRHPPPSPRHPVSQKLNKFPSVELNFNQISKATHGFSTSSKIGGGDYGSVYKVQLPSGHWIAVKRVKKEHFDSAEFNSEVEILSKIEHRNLVKLLGYVDKGNERLIVTEYVTNGTLREHLDGQMGKILDFNQRLEIAIDVAHGLTYLHLYAGKQIIHRDVKSSNILLNEDLRAKVADFGFARVGPHDSDRSLISTNVKGTMGYLDPEYMKTYKLNSKSDVYSFGMLLVEILTGRRPLEPRKPIEEKVTIKWAINSYNKGDILRLLDPQMELVDYEIAKKMLCLAFQCAAPIRGDRPDMKTVGEQLWAIRRDYQATKKGSL